MDIMLVDMHPESGEFQAVGYFYGWKAKFEFASDTPIHWPYNKGPPANRPQCGFTGDAAECQTTGTASVSKGKMDEKHHRCAYPLIPASRKES
ncbi:atrial natriuretic peptide receptor 1-like [Ostrea edulis]|uniref:atrial natriuretic peptide receptor 1-like n=1 Tax=Ostrea edulis TaxID=37623 RepID=UPI0024AF12A7|nr:atrial natriuretic peptide receptor 1-like [Ostrea edulis]